MNKWSVFSCINKTNVVKCGVQSMCSWSVVGRLHWTSDRWNRVRCLAALYKTLQQRTMLCHMMKIVIWYCSIIHSERWMQSVVDYDSVCVPLSTTALYKTLQQRTMLCHTMTIVIWYCSIIQSSCWIWQERMWMYQGGVSTSKLSTNVAIR
jgi:hypothetical protein